MISNTKMLAHLENYFGEKNPITADIFLNNYCNNRCPYCRYADRGGEYMSFEDFKSYASLLWGKGVKGLIITGGGEPTIATSFDSIAEWLESKGAEWGVNTNFNAMKYIKPSFLKISLDAWDRGSYLIRRGVDAYDVVIKNIETYLSWKKENNIKTRVGIQIVVDCLESAQKFYEAHKNLEVDYISFRPLETLSGGYYNENHKNEEQRRSIVKWLEEKKKEDDKILINFKWYKTNKKFKKCYANFSQVAINHLGEMLYCCHKPNSIIGHIAEPDVWEKKKRATTDMCTCEIPCRLTGPNEIIEMIEEEKEETAFV